MLDTIRAEDHAREALALAEELHYRAGRVFGIGLLAAIAAARGQLAHGERLWTAFEDEDAVAPLGGWRRHRQACEAVIHEARGPEVAGPSTPSAAFTLDDAVRLALDDASD